MACGLVPPVLEVLDFLGGEECEFLHDQGLIEIEVFIIECIQGAAFDVSVFTDEDVLWPHVSDEVVIAMEGMARVCEGVDEVPELFFEEGLVDHLPVRHFFAEDEGQHIVFRLNRNLLTLTMPELPQSPSVLNSMLVGR